MSMLVVEGIDYTWHLPRLPCSGLLVLRATTKMRFRKKTLSHVKVKFVCEVRPRFLAGLYEEEGLISSRETEMMEQLSRPENHSCQRALSHLSVVLLLLDFPGLLLTGWQD